MPQPPTYLKETASQTAGPYVHIGLIPQQAGFDIFEKNFGNVLVTPETQGERIRIEGRVFDGLGEPLRDVLVEIWQANAAGKYNHPADRQDKPIDPHFRGWGRAGSDFETGLYSFETIKPGPVPGTNGATQAPHILIGFYSRGLLTHLYTRLYFSDEAANASDTVLALVPADRRDTLIAKKEQRDGTTVYRLDLSFQPEHETVFFDV